MTRVLSMPSMVVMAACVGLLLIVSQATTATSLPHLSSILHHRTAAAAACAEGTSGEGSCSGDASSGSLSTPEKSAHFGQGGEVQQDGRAAFTTNFGTVLADDENSLKANERGPTLLEDLQLREKITHFDHERIPERVVHARGTGAHGVFETTNAAYISKYSKAQLFQKDGETCDTFVRFSTVAGPRGSVDTPRDVRGFATRFYTKEGNWDLVGNNIPVFFIQDSMKFPDLAHAVKQEPDRAFPSAASAHDNFWDWISLMPESMHMIQWAMSDRALPRSYRTMEGFGVNTFRLVPAEGNATFVKFHWKPRLGLQSTVWDEAMKLQAANNDYHRQDLWDAIAAGDFPVWDLGVQVFTEEEAAEFDFDVLDATKVVPEELVPVVLIGKMTLNRNVDNFFQETEQVAYHPGNVVPGIDFSNDPLLQGRLFSYVDTQLLRLGGPNFHQIPINQPKCPYFNLQQDGFHRQTNRKGRTNYAPNSRSDADAPTLGDTRQSYTGLSRRESGEAQRSRARSFKDHYTQARLFFLSQTETEQNHIAMAFTFELSKVLEVAVRERMVAHLQHVDSSLAARVANALGLDISRIAPAATLTPPKEVTMLSPKLSIILNMGNNTLQGREAGILVTDGADGDLVEATRAAFVAAGASVKIIGPHMGKLALNGSTSSLEVDLFVQAAPSALFDCVAIIASDAGTKKLLLESAAVNFAADAWAHLKAIAYTSQAEPLLAKAGVDLSSGDAGLVSLSGKSSAASFVEAAKAIKVWAREPSVRTIP